MRYLARLVASPTEALADLHPYLDGLGRKSIIGLQGFQIRGPYKGTIGSTLDTWMPGDLLSGLTMLAGLAVGAMWGD